MLDPKPEDYAKLQKWPMINDPLAAFKDYKPIYRWLRWLKLEHLYMHYIYWKRRKNMAQSKEDLQSYFEKARIPLPRYKWEYLKLRKSWYIVPLHWDRFAAPDCHRILDVGCGDGDVTQRAVEAIEAEWKKTQAVHPIEVVGIDLGQSRIDNAKQLCSSSYPEIQFNFTVADLLKGLPFPEQHFDYALCTGVLEILAEAPARIFIENLCRLVKKGIYIEDLADRYPGGYPRTNLEDYFRPHGFFMTEHHWELTEPFSLVKIPDPCWRDMTWPILLSQVFWLERR